MAWTATVPDCSDSFCNHDRVSMYAHVMSTFGVRGREVTVRVYLSGPVTEQDTEMISNIAAEIIADFPEGYTIAEESLSIEEEREQMLDFWAFHRADD